METYKFSLIMATLGRSDEIAVMIDSLLVQTYKNFELIIVDQNEDDRVMKIYEQYKNKLELHYFKSNKKGISFNRNIGLGNTSGNIIAFPDDDCEYDSNTLEKVVIFFNTNENYDFYTCNTKEKNSDNTVLQMPKKNKEINKSNFLNLGISITIFIRSESITNFLFDEQLGVGAPFGSGEESDLLLYLIKNKTKGRYHAGDFIYHPGKSETLLRIYSYSMGFGALIKKSIRVYRFYSMFFLFSYMLLRNICKLFLRPRDKTTHFVIKGRLSGFIRYKPIINT